MFHPYGLFLQGGAFFLDSRAAISLELLNSRLLDNTARVRCVRSLIGFCLVSCFNSVSPASQWGGAVAVAAWSHGHIRESRFSTNHAKVRFQAITLHAHSVTLFVSLCAQELGGAMLFALSFSGRDEDACDVLPMVMLGE